MNKIHENAESLAKMCSTKIMLDIEVLDETPLEFYEEFKTSLPAKVVGVGNHEKNIFWILDGDFFLWFTTNSAATWREQPGKHAKIKICLNDRTLYYNKKSTTSGLEFINGHEKMLDRLRSLQ